MNAETLLETLAAAVHQAALSLATPEPLASVKVRSQRGPWGGDSFPRWHDLQSSFVVDLLSPRDVFASQVDGAVRNLARQAASLLEQASRRGESSIVACNRGAQSLEHPEPAHIAPRIRAFAGLTQDQDRWIATIRAPFGISTVAD